MSLAKGFLLFSSLLIGSFASDSPPSAIRVKVDVSLVGDDGLTQNLRVTLRRHIVSSNDLQLSPGDEHAFRITTSTNVVADTLGGRGVLIYRALLFRRDEMLADRMGVCFQRDVGKCASDIVRSFEPVMIDYAARGELP